MRLADTIGQGGLSGIRIADDFRDREAIVSYIAQNSPVSTFDIQLCCHMGKWAVLDHLADLMGQARVERVGKKYRSIP
jgi:esterase/lipase superfamily enzyme